jgi:O-methyltransferase
MVEAKPYVAQTRDEGRDWPLFGFSMAGHRRLDNVHACVEQVLRDNIPGDFIETGVWRGGMTILMRALLKAHGVTDRVVWVADSFEGLPAPRDERDGADLSDVQQLKVSLEQVQENFSKFGLLDDQVRFLKGWFEDTLPQAPIERLAILRLDGDLYSSTMDALKNLYHKVSAGGFVIVDDYHSWPSCKAAVTDFLRERGLTPKIQDIDWTGAYWRVE